ncbi:AfsA-related hotdog domain-containing protein [Streptomyces sp. NPDC018610]|uniref:AfsA-related hotdog domain-containing protein n=1 Tax=Streptomyces sp. NPDC018610 TaxID=3365049 RepID=UPI00378744B1
MLSSERTVPCAWVHKRAVEQVLVTDVAEEEGRLLAMAQLPRTHRLYNDVPRNGRRRHDLLLLGEAARQSSEAIVHRLMGVPLDRQFVIGTMRVAMLDEKAVCAGPEPENMVAELVVHKAKKRPDGTPRHLRASVICHLKGVPAVEFSGTLMLVAQDSYEALREEAGAVAVGSGGVRPSPAEVGRTDPRNVVIADLRREDGRLTARLDVDPGDPVFFDHALDHYPAMLLGEGARQVALAALPGAVDITEYAFTFEQFAELAAPVAFRATPRENSVAIEIVQGEETVATGEITID